MKKSLSRLGIGSLIVVGLVALILANMGMISFGKPYVYQALGELPAPNPVVVFENVNLVPMDSERVIEGQTVLVRDGMIETIGESDKVSIPDGALAIDGRGKYLMPGLVDMHVHIEYENDMLLMVANGVTSVRNLWGNTGKKRLFGMPDQLQIQRQIEAGTLIGPTIYTSGPVMEGFPASHPLMEVFTSPEAARESVRWQAEGGYEFIKVSDHLTPEVYQAILDQAGKYDLPVVGHVPFTVGLDGVLEGGQRTIEHLNGYVDSDTAAFVIPEDRLDEYAQKTRQAGVWNVVTLSVYPKTKVTPEGFQILQDQTGMRYLSPGTRLLSPFMHLMFSRSITYSGADYPQRITMLNQKMVHALHEAGAGILLGTDSAQAYHLPGYAAHEELAMLVEAGLSPYEALAAGTRDAAEAMSKAHEFGTIAEGKRADLLLLDKNPLSDVGALQERAGVMLRGRWLTQEQIESLLDGLAESYQPNLLERAWPLVLIGLGIYLIWRMRRPSGRKSNDD
jgi:imidazolonepropionase-like amidohydrolase